MKMTEIIETLRNRLNIPTGRHLYGVLGNYQNLDEFSTQLLQTKTIDGCRFPEPFNVNKGILNSIPDSDFKQLAENEARRPEPTAAHIAKAFEIFLRASLKKNDLLILKNLELIFAYQLELNLLRTLATDEKRIILLLPGKKQADRVMLFPDYGDRNYILPLNLIADNHLWEIKAK